LYGDQQIVEHATESIVRKDRILFDKAGLVPTICSPFFAHTDAEYIAVFIIYSHA